MKVAYKHSSLVNNKVTSKRYSWIDIVKAIGIFGVVYIHAPEAFLYEIPGSTLLLPTIYFRFAVPLFIIISFFLAERLRIERSLSISTRQFWKKRLPRLLVPYILWSIFYYAYELYRRYPKPFQLSFTDTWAGQYYLFILLQLTLLAPFLHRLKLTPNRLAIAGLATLFFTYIPFAYFSISKIHFISNYNPSYFFYWLFYVLFAWYVAREYEAIQEKINKIKVSIRLGLLFSIPLLFIVENWLIERLKWIFDGDTDPYLRLTTLLVSPLIFLLSIDLNLVLEKIKIPKFIKQVTDRAIALLSKWTLGIYCLNPFVILFTKDALENVSYQSYVLNLPTGVRFFLPAIAMIFVCGVSIALSWIIARLRGAALVK